MTTRKQTELIVRMHEKALLPTSGSNADTFSFRPIHREPFAIARCSNGGVGGLIEDRRVVCDSDVGVLDPGVIIMLDLSVQEAEG